MYTQTSDNAGATSCPTYAHADCYRNAESDAHTERYAQGDTAATSDARPAAESLTIVSGAVL
jgi:hypothetical protein